MTKLLAAALALAALTGAAYAGDYTDKSDYSCDKDRIESEWSIWLPFARPASSA